MVLRASDLALTGACLYNCLLLSHSLTHASTNQWEQQTVRISFALRNDNRGHNLPKYVLLPSKHLLWAPSILRKLRRTSCVLRNSGRRLQRTLPRTTAFWNPSETPFEKCVIAWPMWLAPETSVAECTKPSHSQSLANFVANFHSQGISAARTKFRNFRSEAKFSSFHSQNHSHSLANSFATLNSQLLLWDLVVRIR